MDGAIIPGGLGTMRPWYLNLFENVLTIQFNHRMLGYLIALAALATLLAAWRSSSRATALWAFAAVLAQIALGVVALLSHLQLGLALAHQAGAVLLFGLALYQLHAETRRR
jgi:cytochrome c oxidase assembly protein subunit 15